MGLLIWDGTEKICGESLPESIAINPLTNCLLGVDQIFICCKDGALTADKCSWSAIGYTMGAKFAITASIVEECEISQAVIYGNMKQ